MQSAAPTRQIAAAPPQNTTNTRHPTGPARSASVAAAVVVRPGTIIPHVAPDALLCRWSSTQWWRPHHTPRGKGRAKTRAQNHKKTCPNHATTQQRAHTKHTAATLRGQLRESPCYAPPHTMPPTRVTKCHYNSSVSQRSVHNSATRYKCHPDGRSGKKQNDWHGCCSALLPCRMTTALRTATYI